MAKNNNQEDKNLEQIEQSIGKAEKFVESNKNAITYALLGVLVIIIAIMAYNNYIREPQRIEAHDAIYPAQKNFQQDSLKLALFGNENTMGFLDVIDEYSFTKSANVAHLYSAMCYIHLSRKDSTISKEEYLEEAIKHLEDYSSDDIITSSQAIGLMGDAYLELGNIEKGAKLYEDAAFNSPNEFTSPYFLMKAGKSYSILGNHQKALDMFREIKNSYPKTFEGNEAKKYIAREEAQL